MRPAPVEVAFTVQGPDDPAWSLIERVRRGGFAGRVEIIGSTPGATTRSLERLSGHPNLLFLGGDERSIVRDLARAQRFAPLTVVITSELSEEARERIKPFAEHLTILGPGSEGIASARHSFTTTPMELGSLPGEVGVLSAGAGILGSLGAEFRAGEDLYHRLVSLGEGWFSDLPAILRDWESDPSLALIGLVMHPDHSLAETLDTIREVNRTKPVVLLWPGEGGEAIARHTGALVTGSPRDFTQALRTLKLFHLWEGGNVALVGVDQTMLDFARTALTPGRIQIGPIGVESARLLQRLGVVERANPIVLPPGSGAEDLIRSVQILREDELVDAVVIALHSGGSIEPLDVGQPLSLLNRLGTTPIGLLLWSGQPLASSELLSSADPAELWGLLDRFAAHGRRRGRERSSELPRRRPRRDPGRFSMGDFGLETATRPYDRGPALTAWRDHRLGPLVSLGPGQGAILPRDRAEADEWLSELGIEETGSLTAALLGLRACFEAIPELERIRCELTSEPGVLQERGLEISFT